MCPSNLQTSPLYGPAQPRTDNPADVSLVRNVASWLDSSRDLSCPGGVMDNIGPSEGLDPGSSPGWDTFLHSHFARQRFRLAHHVVEQAQPQFPKRRIVHIHA